MEVAAFKGYRERLHGHNYQVGVRVYGSKKISNDGYVVDFGNIKKITRAVCKELNEHFLCPMHSDVIDVVLGTPSGGGDSVQLTCEDGSVFVFPRADCALLPIVHATAEELAIYLWSRLLDGLNSEWLRQRGVHTLEVIVMEAVGQQATFRQEVPTTGVDNIALDVRKFILEGKAFPMPCPSFKMETSGNNHSPMGHCKECRDTFSLQLKKIAEALNSHDAPRSGRITESDLQSMLKNA